MIPHLDLRLHPIKFHLRGISEFYWMEPYYSVSRDDELRERALRNDMTPEIIMMIADIGRDCDY